MLEIALAIVFLGAGGSAALAVLGKIPFLLQVPPQLIEESFVTRPPRLRSYLEPVAAFLRERRYIELYYALLVRVLHRLRLTLLRLERVVYRALEALQGRERNLSAAEERYWSELKHWKHEVRTNGNHIPEEVLTEPAPAELTSTGSSEKQVPV